MAEIVWQSPGKNHLGHSYLTVKKTGHYLYSERAGVDSVAFILVDRKADKYCAISERKPPLDEFTEDGKRFLTSAFGGSLDMENGDEVDVVVTEVKEEAGFSVTREDCEYVGKVMCSTQSNQMVHLYLVNVNSDKQGEREPETAMEAEAEMIWFDFEDAYKFEDWKLMTILFKAKAMDLI